MLPHPQSKPEVLLIYRQSSPKIVPLILPPPFKAYCASHGDSETWADAIVMVSRCTHSTSQQKRMIVQTLVFSWKRSKQWDNKYLIFEVFSFIDPFILSLSLNIHHLDIKSLSYMKLHILSSLTSLYSNMKLRVVLNFKDTRMLCCCISKVDF